MIISIDARDINPLNAEINPICHLLVLLGAHHILHVSRIRVNCTKITVIEVVFWFPPNHWYSKFQAASLSICPLAQMLRTSFAYNMRIQWLIFISKLHTKITYICSFYKFRNRFPTCFQCVLPTNIAKYVGMMQAAPS